MIREPRVAYLGDTACAMSEENVKLLFRGQDALNRGDLDAFLEFQDPDVEIFPRILGVEGGVSYRRGHDGIRTWWEDLHAVFPSFRSEIAEVRDLGDVIISRVTLIGQGLESGAATEQAAWQVVKVRDQKAVWWGIFVSEAEALEAAGLSE
jgi:ketosteroid isomerase-like protein